MNGSVEALAAHELWSQEAIEAVHVASLQLLERAGVRVGSRRAQDVLLAAGCRTGPDDRVLIPAEVVAGALAACPAVFTIAAGAGGHDLRIDAEPSHTYVHNVGDTRDAVDPRSGVARRAEVSDLARMTRVLHHLGNVDAIVPPHQPAGVPGVLEDLYAFLVMASETDKPIIGPGISTAYQVRYLREMSTIRTGADGGADRYGCLFGFSPVSPLQLGAEVSEAMLEAAGLGGVAFLALPCPQMGTTAPGSLAAAVASQNAEALAVIVLLQSAQPGSPVLYGARLSGIDPRSGRFTSGTPEMSLTAIAAVLLARSYGLAADCFGPTSCSRVIDAQFGWQHAVNASLGLLPRPRFLSGLSDMQSASGTNPEAAVLDDEIIGDLRYARAGRFFDAETLDVDAMVEGALRGGYLGTKHTRRFLRTELRGPGVAFVGERREWAESGHASVVDAASERVAAIMAQEPLGLSDDLALELGDVIGRASADAGVSAAPAPAAVLESCRDVRS